MNLATLFDGLSIPVENDSHIINAVSIPKLPGFKVGVNTEGYPVILIPVNCEQRNSSIKNFRLKYIQLSNSIKCRVKEGDKLEIQNYTLITFISDDRQLQEYFLDASEPLLSSLGSKPSNELITNSLAHFIEIFRSLIDTPTNTVHGLWSELFLIESAAQPKTLLNYWHSTPEEKFDFNAGIELIEVKSNSNFERIHIFSSDQLNPPDGTQALIASIFIRQHSEGRNIKQLIESISQRVQDVLLLDKLNSIVFKTLGSSLEQSIQIKFDYNIARDSLRFYRHQDIVKIEKMNIPTEISEVRYKSDLTNIKSVDLLTLTSNGGLFRSVISST